MEMSVCKIFTFDAAHYLPNYEGKCKNMHGHSWLLEVEVSGRVNDTGMIVDFVGIKEVVNQTITDKLDHSLLNDICPNPTCENLLVWIWTELQKTWLNWSLDAGLTLERIRLYETPGSFAELKLRGGFE